MYKILLCLSITLGTLTASTIGVGTPLDKLNKFKYETPQGRDMRVSKDIRLVIIAYEKDTGELVNSFLDTKNQYYLEKNKAVFIADIHKMPSIIATLFALPKLKKFKHPIYLHYDEEFSKDLPLKSDKVTLLEIKNGKIKRVNFIATKDELQMAIEKH